MDNEVRIMFWAKTDKAGLVRITRRFYCDEEDDLDEFTDMVEDELEDWVTGDRFREFGVEEYGMKILR